MRGSRIDPPPRRRRPVVGDLTRRLQRVRLLAQWCETAPVAIAVELEDRWIVGLRDATVESTRSEEFRLVVAFAGGAELTIEGATTLGPTARATERLDLWANPSATTDSFSGLVGRKVLSAVAFKTVHLRIVFSPGLVLRVPADNHHEPWQIVFPSGQLLVSQPGGGLSTWSGS
ncbi:DUF6188 family protein [Nocardioides panzhihuensis]|uniref:DUF6188 family protein n=1 Tax=Nocardioides panzhihuensis TaxID=860243 RepID=UPI003CCD8DF9